MGTNKVRGSEVSRIIGKHERNKNNEDVEAIWFPDLVIINYFPRGLTRVFPNLKGVAVVGCNLLEISREDLRGLEDLKYIYLHSTKIQSLPEDLFVGMTKLQEISFMRNKELESGVTKKLFEPVISNGLNYVDLSWNKCVDAFYCPGYEGTLNSFSELMEKIEGNNRKDEGDTEDLDDEMDVDWEELPEFEETDGDATNKVDFNASQTLESSQTDDETDTKMLSSSDMNNNSQDPTANDESEPEMASIFNDSNVYYIDKSKLKSQSNYFLSALQKDPESIGIKIKNFTNKTVEDLVKFIETGEVSNDCDHFSLYELAAILRVVDLEVECEEIILKRMDKSNILEVLRLAKKFQSFTMKREALEAAGWLWPCVKTLYEKIAKKSSRELGEMDRGNFKEVIEVVKRQMGMKKRRLENDGN
jgi:hypothetical protein